MTEMQSNFKITEGIKDRALGFYSHLVEQVVNTHMRNVKGKLVLDLVKIFAKEGEWNMVVLLVEWVHAEMESRQRGDDDLSTNELEQLERSWQRNPMPPRGLISFLKE